MQRQFEINHSTAATLRSQQRKIQQMWGIQACMPPCAKHLAPQDVQRGRRGQHIQRGEAVQSSSHPFMHLSMTHSHSRPPISGFLHLLVHPLLGHLLVHLCIHCHCPAHASPGSFICPVHPTNASSPVSVTFLPPS